MGEGGREQHSELICLLDAQVYNFNVPTFGPGVVYDVEQKVRLEQFKWFTDALKTDRLKEYVPAFIEEAEVRITSARVELNGHHDSFRSAQTNSKLRLSRICATSRLQAHAHTHGVSPGLHAYWQVTSSGEPVH